MRIKNRAFTLAEVLITLAIIGIIAAILFPSILANYTEKTFNAKRQALLARMSQAMGELSEQFPNYEDATCNIATGKCTDNASALKFLSEGLSKVYKIASICDSDSLASCDISDTITRIDGTKYNLKNNSSDFLKYAVQSNSIYWGDGHRGWEYNTKSAGFITKNGESVLVFYNPRCKARQPYNGAIAKNTIDGVGTWMTSDIYMCVNMIYDLNGGKKKPNRVGDDIGFMSVFYSDSPYVVAPKISLPKEYNTETTSVGSSVVEVSATPNNYTFENAKAACHALGENYIVPSFEQMASILINHPLYADQDLYKARSNKSGKLCYWTSSPCSASENLMLELDYTIDESGIYCSPRTDQLVVTCVQDN